VWTGAGRSTDAHPYRESFPVRDESMGAARLTDVDRCRVLSPDLVAWTVAVRAVSQGEYPEPETYSDDFPA
jgi:hypothetical protein